MHRKFMVCKKTKGGTTLKVVGTGKSRDRIVDANGHDVSLEEVDAVDWNAIRVLVNYKGRTWELQGTSMNPYIIIGEE